MTFKSLRIKPFTLKTTLHKYSAILGVFLILIACSTKRNSFLARNSHALSTEYNILYNGEVALNKGILDLKTQYKDNFWERLPIERMQVNKEDILPGQNTKNPNFERAETKAAKAIQKHSMNIAGSEKNPQMDEAHLILGKARYYDQRFVPALEAFNYILYKYPNSSKIYEAKIWREKTNMRMDNDALAIDNLRKLLKEIKFKDQIYADANATLSQAFLNLEQKDSAVAKLKLARDFTKSKEEKARYHFILGQIYEELGYKDSAFASFQSVIDMKRKAARQYVIQSHIKQANQFDVEKGDTIVFLKKFNDLLKDRENRPFLDVLNHQMALFYDKKNKNVVAEKYYNISLKTKSTNQYLLASNYRNIADIYFNRAKYITAGKYYDSTLVQLNARSREHKQIEKKRLNLNDVIKYEGIATINDSIINVFKMSEPDKVAYYENYIAKLKKEEEAKKLLLEKQAKEAENNPSSTDNLQTEDRTNQEMSNKKAGKDASMDTKKAAVQPSSPNNAPPIASSSSVGQSNFYFYNSKTVAFGKIEFEKKWGKREYKNNWRLSSSKSNTSIEGDDDTAVKEDDKDNTKENKTGKEEKLGDPYTADFYIKQLPTKQTEIDSIAKERNFAYYQLGVIYKEKFKEYKLAANKLETLLTNNPEERLVLPSMYNLFKIYEIIDKDKALAMRERIINQYPDSRYAQILSAKNSTDAIAIETPETSYNKLYKVYESGDYKKALIDSGIAIDQYTGEEIVPKFELLKANIVGKLKGIIEYKKALNYVALSYPNSDEGKQAESLLGTDVPKLEALKFYQDKPLSWKILYKSDNPEDKNTKKLQEKIKKFISDRSLDKLTTSYDIYTMDKNFVVIHGMKTEEYAKGIASILKELKEYKIQDIAYVISNENYKIVQINKNFEEYLTTKPSAPIERPINTNPTEFKPIKGEKGVTPVQPTREQLYKEKEEQLNQMPPQMPTGFGTPPQDSPETKKEKR